MSVVLCGTKLSCAHAAFIDNSLKEVTIDVARTMPDDSNVILSGYIIKSLGNEKYTFQDATGNIKVEIDDDDWNGIDVNSEQKVKIFGEVEKGFFKSTYIDVDKVVLAE